jgi:PAS domain S-box-containing protein
LKGEKAKHEEPIRILHVDDEANQLEFTKLFLERLDKDIIVDSASSPEEAIELQKKNNYDCVLSDYKMLSMTGIELAQKVREKSNIPFILYTGQGSEEVAESAFEAGVDDYLKKENEPSHYQVLSKRIRDTVEKYRTEQLYRKVVEESRDGIIIIQDFKIVFANQAMCILYGCKGPDYFIGKNVLDLLVETKEDLTENLASNKGGALEPFEVNIRSSTGAIRIAQVSASEINYLGQEAFLCFFRDMTQNKRMEERLEATHKQATQLLSLGTVDEIAKITLDIMQTVFEYQVISFQLVENGHLIMKDLRGAPMLKKTLPIKGKGVTAKAAREKKSILIKDTRKCSYFFKGTVDSLSELAVPVLHDGKTVAVLNVESLQLDDFTDEDVKLLETLAYHVSYAYDRLKVSNRKGDKSEDDLKLNYALGKLENAEKVTSLVRGELKGSLRSIKNASGFLRVKPDMLPDIADTIDVSADHASRVADMIDDTLSSSIDGDLVEVNTIVKTVMDSVYIPRTVKTKVSYQAGLLVAKLDKEKIVRVLENLVNNAVEAMSTGGTLEVKINSTEDAAVIEVRDTGDGILENVLEKLYEPFNTTKDGHSGLGLAFSKQMLDNMDGDLKIDTGNRGTIISMTLPVRRKTSGY